VTTTAAPASTRHALVGASGTRRTIRTMAATILGLLPLAELFTDVRWLVDVVAAIVVVGGAASAARYWQRPRVWHTWFGLALLVPWLTLRFASAHAFAGFVPTGATLTDVSHLMNQVRDTTSNGVAPVPTDRAITFVLAAIAGLVFGFVDLVAVVGRRPALAGVPLLVVFTVSGAVPRHPVSWVWFAAAAAGLLLLLSVDARDDVHEWGRLIPRAGEARPSAALGVSGPRIAAIAVLIAILVPLLVPSRPRNLLANAFHNGSGGDSSQGGGFGAGGVSLDPFANLKGELQSTKPVTLFTVTVSQPTATPYYLRANVLSNYTDTGWRADAHGLREDIGTTMFSTVPPDSPQSTTDFTAALTIDALADNPPVFARPVAVTGVDSATSWSQSDQLLIGTKVHKGEHFTEDVQQPNPTITDLSDAPAQTPSEVDQFILVPASIPRQVVDLVQQLTRTKSTAYAKARALSDFFTQPANGFVYSLQTKSGDSGSDLVDFLNNRAGFCQQYAAAMGIMLRLAGIPSRVVLGYTHPAPDAHGKFVVTTNNAHAWVEAYFAGLGWIPFDPTPISAAAGAATTNLAWAPHPVATGGSGPDVPSRARSTARSGPSSSAAADQSPGSGSAATSRHVSWSLVGVLIGVLAAAGLSVTPAAVRWRRRHERLRAARRGDPDPLWTELSDTAQDLGYVWSPARSPRQVVSWLAPDVDGPSVRALQTLALAVEQSRYRAAGGERISLALVAELRTVESQLRSRRSRATRIRSRLLPASLGWRIRPRRRGKRAGPAKTPSRPSNGLVP